MIYSYLLELSIIIIIYIYITLVNNDAHSTISYIQLATYIYSANIVYLYNYTIIIIIITEMTDYF